MKILKILCIMFVIFGLAIAGYGFYGMQVGNKKAKLIQLVTLNKDSADKKEISEKLGDPKKLIIEDEKAFLDKQSEEGAEYVDQEYLEENNVIPTEMQTVELVGNGMMMAGSIVAFLSIIGAFFAHRIQKLDETKNSKSQSDSKTS